MKSSLSREAPRMQTTQCCNVKQSAKVASFSRAYMPTKAEGTLSHTMPAVIDWLMSDTLLPCLKRMCMSILASIKLKSAGAFEGSYHK